MDEERQLYILTELYPENSLRQFLRKNKGLISLEVKCNLVFQVAQALNYMHSLDPPVIHWDVKPLNVFVNSDLSAKIGDFGLAKEIRDEFQCEVNTDTVSTLEYMSPETLNQGLYRKESDIYSFGVLAYEVLSEESFMDKEGFEMI